MVNYTIGVDGQEEKKAREENHGKVLYLGKEGDSIKVVPLVYLNSYELPQEIIDMKTTEPKKYIEEAVKRTVFSINTAEMWLDGEKVKEHNDKLTEGAERTWTKYTFQTAFGTKKAAKDFSDVDPIAWLIDNPEKFEASPYYTSGKFGNNAVTPKEKSYIIVYVPDYDAEMLLEVTQNQLAYIKSGLEMGGNLSKFNQNVYNLKKVKQDGKNQYMFIRIGEVSEEDDVPAVTTLNIDELDFVGIEYDDIEKRKHVLELIGVELPTDVTWNK